MSGTFTPSPAELALVQKIFAHPDAQKLGALTGEIAVQIFSGSKLPPAVLGEVWSLADRENNGWLSKKGAAMAVRLMGWAQKGEPLREELIYKPGPLPTIEGVSDLVPQSTGGSAKPPSISNLGLPPLTSQDKTKFTKLFMGAGPVNGLLNGDKARDILVKSKLPVDKLSQIWSLADTQNRGALDSTDFTIAMYLVQACMSGQLSFVPTTLPPGLYEQAGGRPLDGVASHSTGGSGSFSPSLTGSFPGRNPAVSTPLNSQATGIRPQMTGSSLRPGGGPALPSRPSAAALGGSAFGTPVQSHNTGQAFQPPWDVTASEKITSDGFFDTLDTERKGYIEGDVAVPFMLQSQLPEDVLAQIWDLADMNNDGRLTRDGFAVAMHLIQAKLAGKDIPASLPLSLIPPSMRGKVNAAPFAVPPSSPPAVEPLRDLLWDDTPASATSATPTLQPQRTGALSPQHTAAATPSFSSPAPAPSAFASPAPTGSAYGTPASAPFSQADPFGNSAAFNNRDLLGDDDEPPTKSPPLADKSAEIGNTQNQLNSTNRSLETAKTERASMERTLNDQAAQLSALQTQLSSAKAAYETETSLLSTLRDRYATQTAQIQKAREELIRAESDLSALRVEKTEIEGNLLREKEEVRELQRKMHEVGVEAETIKVLLEKLRKEAKQQKGLLAIAKKQLVTREHEKEKVEKEAEDARQEVAEAVKERQEIEAQIEAPASNGTALPEPAAAPSAVSDEAFAAAISQPLPMSPPEAGSPTTSPKSNNPFDRLMFASGSRPQSPFASTSGSRPQSPFGNTSVPAPTIAPVNAAADDPFGFESEEPGKASAEMEGASTDIAAAASQFPDIQPYPAVSTSPINGPSGELFSPSETENWSTPPLTATADQAPQVLNSAGETPASDHPDETDINSSLKEIEAEESDSSDDEEPLSKRRESLKGKEPEGDSIATGSGSAGPSFDDAFGQTDSQPDSAVAPTSGSATATPSSPLKDAFGMASMPAFTSPPAVAATTPAAPTGLSDFDEALGKLPSKTNGSAAPFSFDASFDDNFDFGSASADAASKPAAEPTNGSAAHNGFDAVFMSQAASPAPGPVVTPQANTAPQGAASFSFEDAFGTSSTAAQPGAQAAASNGMPHISFDDAFGGAQSKDALSFDKAFGAESSRGSMSSQTQQGKTAFPSSSSPTSPQGATSPPHSFERNTASPPPRSISPPIRHTSPGPRPSTAGSSKGDKHKDKDAPTRHSRLSIRLPFGKKKSKQDAAPPMPSHLSQAPTLAPLEEPETAQTPAVDDDVEGVKQLCGMGFSRTQAVAALEQHGYDVQKALNSLLGSP
ncbi:hypothetical protein OE88DRAFT_1653662 [Heliocybe sulcata]|uniref:Uncharacterized protein n=1 Tax=Heliocybe sulcata TaxID=5364 RepID=A0A5C3NG71_9AGAM|nr:hypothetical protein OE88DRAFT_1653662 [Heliocybe sulcata]